MGFKLGNQDLVDLLKIEDSKKFILRVKLKGVEDATSCRIFARSWGEAFTTRDSERAELWYLIADRMEELGYE